MRTPDSPTRAPTRPRPRSAAAPEAGQGVVAPWGQIAVREIVEQPARGEPGTARQMLKAEQHDELPEGKALARRRYFSQQRGLPDVDFLGASIEPLPAAVRRAHARAAKAAATMDGASAFAAVAKAAMPGWRDLGPTLIPHGQTYGEGTGASPSVSGRCCGIVVDRANALHLLLASAGGGLWRSLDGGATWSPLTDQQPTLIMGAIAQAPSASAIVYAATGDGDGQIPYGMGLLRSSDGGQTWALVPNARLTGLGCYDLAVHPSAPLVVWVATDNGLFVSNNGGVSAQLAIDELCWSVSIHPTQPNELLAACPSGLKRSIDGGASWSAVALSGVNSASDIARLEARHAGGNGAVVYAAAAVDGAARLWRRASFGGGMTALNAPADIDIGQAWYDWNLAVSPHNADEILWGAIDLHRGRRSGSTVTWANVSSRVNQDSIHPDQHFALFDPTTPGSVYACNDGGLYHSRDGCAHWRSLNPGLGITEFEFLTQLDSDPQWLFGGTQDNGSLALAGPRLWDQVALGDGGDCSAIDRGAASIVFHSYYNMPVERASAIGSQAYAWTRIGPPVPKKYACLFYPPLEAHDGVLVKAGRSLWISANDGSSWDEVLLPTSGDSRPDLASALAIHGTGTIIVGTLAGRLWRVTRGSAGWAGASVAALGTLPGYVSDIAIVGTAAKTVWATCSRLGGGHVFRSLNAGKSFVDRSGTLPDMAVNALVVDPKNTSRVFLATDRGVWQTRNSGKAWSEFNNGLPNVIVGDLLLHRATRRLRAGTRSRGAWELDL